MNKTITTIIGLLLVLSIAPITEARVFMSCEGSCGGGSSVPVVSNEVAQVSNSHFKEDLDKYNVVKISKSIFTSITRSLKFNGVIYKIGFDGKEVTLYDKDKNAVDFPAGLNVEIKPRTLWTRTLVFSRVDETVEPLFKYGLTETEWNALSVTQKNWLIAGGDL